MRRDIDPHRSGLLQLLGMSSLLLGLGAAGLLVLATGLVVYAPRPVGVAGLPGIVLGAVTAAMANRDLHRMQTGRMNPAGKANTKMCLAFAMIGAVLSLLGTLLFWTAVLALHLNLI